jgi:MFS family permease
MTTTLGLLRRRPHYRRLWASEAVSMAGDWFGLVAVATVSYQAPGGGVLALAGALAAHLVPQALSAPLGGWVADRYDKRTVLIAGSLLEGAITVLMLLAISTGHVGVMQVLLAIRSAVSSAREPATGAALPSVVAPDELRAANTLGAVTWSVVFSLGMALGGLVTAISATLALAVDALTFVVAAALLARLPAIVVKSSEAPRTALAEIRDGLRISASPALRRSVFAHAPTALAAGSGWVLLNVVGSALPLAMGAATSIGLLQGIRGASTAVGPLATRWLRGASLDRVADGAAVLVAAGTVLLAASTSFAMATSGVFLWGAGGGALWMILTSEIQENAPAAARGRCLAFFGLGFAVMMSAGGAITALLLDAGWSATVAASALGAASLAGWAALRWPGAPGIASPLRQRA